MPKFPEPPSPAELAAVEPAIRTLPTGMLMWRIYFAGGRHPGAWNTFREFGPTTGRFDHHRPPPQIQVRKILYASVTGDTSFAEVFQDTRVIDRGRSRPWLSAFALASDIALLDLGGDWPTRAGASAAIASGPRPRAQRWSQAIYEAYPMIEGLWYPSSMGGNQPAVALYERARHACPDRPVYHRPLSDPTLTAIVLRAAKKFGYGVV